MGPGETIATGTLYVEINGERMGFAPVQAVSIEPLKTEKDEGTLRHINDECSFGCSGYLLPLKRMSRKKFIKKMMAAGYSRNHAGWWAKYGRPCTSDRSYARLWISIFLFMNPSPWQMKQNSPYPGTYLNL